MIYRNKKTGTVIKTPCKITGKNWELVEDTAKPPVEEETAEEEVPAVSAEGSRKGKK